MPVPNTNGSSANDQKHIKALQNVITEFRDAFETDFFLWKENSQWECISDNDSAEGFNFTEQDENHLFSLLKEASEQKQCRVHEINDLLYIFVPCKSFVPHAKKKPLVAVGIVSSGTMPSLERLANIVFRLLQEKQNTKQLEELNEYYASQVSHDFEELHWLRNLAQHIEYCEVNNDLEDVAEKVLPSLCEIIKTETLLFIPEQSDDNSLQIEPYITGAKNIELNMCREIVEKYKDAALTQPVVHNNNFHNQNMEFDNCPDAFALVPVHKGTFHAGWLLAINQNVARNEKILPELDAISEESLGTFEVGLLAATGTLLANHARNAHLFQEQEHLIVGVIRSLVNSIDAKDPYTCGHSERVGLMAKRLAMQLRMSDQECEQLYMTGLLHDVGKIGIPDNVLCKKGRLTDEEYDIIKQHPEIGHSIIQHLKPLAYALPGVLHHHETYEGTGYPSQLKEEDIPLDGRILAVVDAYDAMTSCRPYRNAMPFEKAEAILLENSGIQWDPKIVKNFFAALKDMHKICERTADDAKDLFNSEHLSNSAENHDSISSAVGLTHTE